MRLPQRNDRGRLDVTMTPMIDIVFLLLVFFIWTSTFEEPEESLPTTLSAEGANAPLEDIQPRDDAEEPVIVEIVQGDEGFQWSFRPINASAANAEVFPSLAGLQEKLRAMQAVQPSTIVILVIGETIPLNEVVKLYDTCRQIGFVRVQFAATMNTSA